MNVHQIDRRILLIHLHAVEDKCPLHFVGLLDPHAATHVTGDDAVCFLAEKGKGLSGWDLAGAEIELSRHLGRPAGIILRRELHGRAEQHVMSEFSPL